MSRFYEPILCGLAVVVAAAIGDCDPASAEAPQQLATWGTQGTGPGQFAGPSGIAIDVSNNIYVADAASNRIEKFANDGTFIAAYGSPGMGHGTFNGPVDLAFDAVGNIYVSDYNNLLIQVFDGNFNFIRQFPALYPTTMTIDRVNNLLYIESQKLISEYALDGTFLRSWNFTFTQPAGPFGISVGPTGLLYTGSGAEDKVRVWSSAGIQQFQWGGTGTPLYFNSADAVAVTTDGIAYVSSASQMQEYRIDGTFVMSWGTHGSGTYQFGGIPQDLDVDSRGNIFVLDGFNYRVIEFAPQAGTPIAPLSWGRLKRLYH